MEVDTKQQNTSLKTMKMVQDTPKKQMKIQFSKEFRDIKKTIMPKNFHMKNGRMHKL